LNRAIIRFKLKIKNIRMSIKDVGKHGKNKKSEDYHSQRREDNHL
jgi:hypothetical protein